MLDELTAQDFEPLVGGVFECRQPEDDAVIACELREVRPLGESGRMAGARSPFSLLFLAAGRRDLGQRVYSLSHPRLTGPLQVFLVPVGLADGGLLLEAVFN